MKRRLGRIGLACGVACSLWFAGCRSGSKVAGTPQGSASATSSARTRGAAATSAVPASAEPANRAALRAAEQRRASRDVTNEALIDRDPGVRRAAARALARIADTRAAELLAKSLADEDPEVIAWSAYGIGSSCRGREVASTRALSARAASLLARPPDARAAKGPQPGSLVIVDPISAVADALGRCGGADAERALTAWLAADPPLSDAAALALGGLASRSGRLDDASLVALLEAASRRPAPLASALQAFARLSGLGAAVRARLLDVARQSIATGGFGRALALRALPNAGEPAVTDLGAALASKNLTPAERADAARGLARLGPEGRAALEAALATLVDEERAAAPENLLKPGFGVLSAALGALTAPVTKSRALLGRLAALEPGGGPVLARRTVALRCRAAELLAGANPASALLARCDPDPKGREGRLALLAVLDRAPLAGSRLQRFNELAAASDVVVRERALDLLAGHAEVTGVPELVAHALDSHAPGDVASAAELVARYPNRVSLDAQALSPHPSVVRALSAAFDTWSASAVIEVRTGLADAAGALQLLGAKPKLEADCASDNPTLRQHAEKALRLLGDTKRECSTFEPRSALPVELAHLLAAPVRLELATDAGALTLLLDPALAPVAATRLADLARSGFFDGIVVHRVVSGFVVQLGDPGGDGYGGAPVPPLRCETSPAPFDPGSVGIALSGRDTGSSQFFVTLARQPHLDGEYALVGRAGPGWDRLAAGDTVHKVTVVVP